MSRAVCAFLSLSYITGLSFGKMYMRRMKTGAAGKSVVESKHEEKSLCPEILVVGTAAL